MRHQPFLVYRIAGETTAKMIINAALAHSFQRMFNGFEETRVVCAQTGAPQHFKDGWLRKLRRAAQTAIGLIKHVAELHGSGVELLQPDGDFARRPRLVGKPRQQRRTILLDPVRLLAK